MWSRKKIHLRNLALCSRPNLDAATELNPAMQEVVKLDPTLEPGLRCQSEIDAIAATTIKQLPCDTAFLKKLTKGAGKAVQNQATWCTLCKQPAFYAVLFAVVALAVGAVFLLMDEIDRFSGSESLTLIVEDITRLDGSEFEPIDLTIGVVDDWFFLNHGMEGMQAPVGLADCKAVGGRVTTINGFPAAQIIFGEDGHVLSIIRSEDFAVAAPGEGEWVYFATPTAPDWQAAVSQPQDGTLCYLLTVRGERSDLDQLLKSLP